MESLLKSNEFRKGLRADATVIIQESIRAVLPDDSVVNALKNQDFEKDISIVAVGKAAWNMAQSAKEYLGDQVKQGIVITKYQHSKGNIETLDIIEAGHPIPDQNAILGGTKILDMVSKLSKKDLILFLVSGGGSALFEKPMEGVTLQDIMGITDQLLANGADITEINTVRKHLSQVKGGRFAEACIGIEIYVLVLSDVIGDRLDVIASGPSYPDTSTSEEALSIMKKFDINIEPRIKKVVEIETPKVVNNCKSHIIGSVSKLCEAAASKCRELGYNPMIMSTSIDCEAKEAGSFLSSIARDVVNHTCPEYMPPRPCAFILGGETIVHLNGRGKGGRNQEIALAAAMGIEDIEGVVIFSVGSDGTDGPTDAAGGLVDGGTMKRIKQHCGCPENFLEENNSYNALKISQDLVITGATGTNVNDLMVILIE